MPPESALRYDRLAAEAGGRGDSHRWLLSSVPEGATVLDCGCAGGYLARALVEERRCIVDGIEMDPAAAARAATVCRHVFVGSLDDEAFLALLAGVYDRILFGDCLEHLREPGEVLRALAARLAPDGRALISVPNIAHWSVRWALLRGRFEYQDAGILDRTHLRFYTYRTARALVERAGFRVLRQEFTCVSPLPIGRPLARWLAGAWPNLFAYQALLEAAPCRA